MSLDRPGPVLGNVARRQGSSYDPPVADWDWSRIVFDHVKIGVRDAEASRRFYRTVLAALGIPSGRASTAASTPISSSAQRLHRVDRYTSGSSRGRALRSRRSTALGWKLVMPIMALPGYSSSTAQRRRALLRRVPARPGRQQHRSRSSRRPFLKSLTRSRSPSAAPAFENVPDRRP